MGAYVRRVLPSGETIQGKAFASQDFPATEITHQEKVVSRIFKAMSRIDFRYSN